MRDRVAITNEVKAKHLCNHQRTIRCKKADKLNRIQIVLQCVNCGMQVGQNQRAKGLSESEIESLVVWNSTLTTDYWKRVYSEADQVFNAEKEQHDKEWWASYDAYLQTPKWKSNRAKVFKRANSICEGCGEAKATEVHHKTYDRVKDEMLFDLVAVCDHCHRKLHPKEEDTVGSITDNDDLERLPSGADDVF